MTHLLTETLEDITKSGHTPDDIVFIGSVESGYRCTWEQFQKLADVDYDSSFGAAQVATDLRIVFTDGSSMWRGEYDGSEWWEYAEPYAEPADSHQITRLTVVGTDRVGWVDLVELHEDND